MTRLTIIIFLLIGYTAVAQNGAPGATGRLVIDLGASPWKFKKLSSQHDHDSLSVQKIMAGAAALPQTKVAELKSLLKITTVRYTFADTAVHTAFYRLEASTDDSNWTVIMDKNRTGEEVKYQSLNGVKSTGNSMAYAEWKKSAYITIPVDGRYRFIRLTVTKLLKGDSTPIIASKGKLNLYGSNETAAPADYRSTTLNDGDWENVGIPHCFNDMDSYPNSSEPRLWHGAVWYRKHLKYMPGFAGKKIYLEFDGINIGAAVYVNGHFKPGSTAVKQPGEVTHVGGFLPFALDITDDLHPGTDNVIAVKVSNYPNDFFTWPGFGVHDGFGMGWGGIVCPVRMYVMDKVHIPLNTYSPMGNWGTYNAIVSADSLNAAVRLQTNVKNDDSKPRVITLQTAIADKQNRVIKTISIQKSVAAGATCLFDTVFKMAHPHLWYPNNSIYGKSYLYKITRTVKSGVLTLDQETSNLGIRTLCWDGDYCYVNGKRTILNGFGNRNIYPGLGSAVPKELQWKDIKLIANAGGNVLRVGHVPATRATLEACDAYGILVMDDSGDNEGNLKDEPANTYKQEYDRDMVISFRNYPSVAIWESNNGVAKSGVKYLPSKTQEIVDQWDPFGNRIIASRSGYPPAWDKGRLVMAAYTNRYAKVAGSPSINDEVYGAFWDGRRCFSIARDDYANEKAFSEWYVNDWLHDMENKACGWIDWMLAETQGESYTIYLNGMVKQRSLGSCALDGNRFPKLKYRIYQNALWVPFKIRPGVTLQSTWNLSGLQTVDAWSNCSQTELFLNGKSLGKRIPDARTKQISWPGVAFQPGKLKIVGFDAKGKITCADSLITAGKPDHIVLTVEKNLVAPDGSKFTIKANGTDAAIVKAMIVDKNGNWCPDADNNIQFSVTGDADYRGSYNFYVTPDKPVTYHSPGDHELAAEGGLMKVAIRSRFKSGPVTVHASSKGLGAGIASFMIQKNN